MPIRPARARRPRLGEDDAIGGGVLYIVVKMLDGNSTSQDDAFKNADEWMIIHIIKRRQGGGCGSGSVVA